MLPLCLFLVKIFIVFIVYIDFSQPGSLPLREGFWLTSHLTIYDPPLHFNGCENPMRRPLEKAKGRNPRTTKHHKWPVLKAYEISSNYYLFPSSFNLPVLCSLGWKWWCQKTSGPDQVRSDSHSAVKQLDENAFKEVGSVHKSPVALKNIQFQWWDL